MTARARIVRLTLGAALASAGLAAFVRFRETRYAPLLFVGMVAVSLGLRMALRVLLAGNTGGTDA